MITRRLLAVSALGACLSGVFGVQAAHADPVAKNASGLASTATASETSWRTLPARDNISTVRLSPKRTKADLKDLRKRAEEARRELESGTKEWEAGRVKVDHAQKELLRTERRLFEAERRLARVRGPVAEIANASYQSSSGQTAAALLAADAPRAALRTVADVQKLNAARAELVAEAAAAHARRERLARSANELRKSSTAEADRLARLMYDLQRKAATATRELTAASKRLGMRASREARTPIGCDARQAARAKEYPNGLVPSWAMCALPQRGELLRADAAIGFYQLGAAYAARFGRPPCVTDSYRPLAEQQRIYAERPSMAAVPGRSLHGLGLAVDLCGGVQSYGSAQYNWMVANAKRFGWYHPDWASGSQFEPWHWEFDPDWT